MTGTDHAVRVGYVPYSSTLSRPGDRRRFVHYARERGITFEIADPAREYDLVVLSECADLSIWCGHRRGKIVYDLIDSYLAIPRTDLKGLLRGAAKFVSRQSRYPQFNHWRAIEAMCRRADAVVCSTEQQKEDIRVHCGNVHIVLDIHASVTHATKQSYSANQSFRLVWEGLPQNISSLAQLVPVLKEVSKRYPVVLHVVTDRSYWSHLGRYGHKDTQIEIRKMFPDAQMHEWRDHDLADVICSCDAAVVPLDLSDPFASGKPENKLLLLWRMGMPVIASASPAYVRAMQNAGIALACADQAEWIATLERLMSDETLRRDAGQKGRAYAESAFSETRMMAAWDAVFESIGFCFEGVQ